MRFRERIVREIPRGVGSRASFHTSPRRRPRRYSPRISGIPQVVRKILRACTHGCDRQLDPPGDARVRHKGSSKASAVVPLGRLLLRGNNITDAGALALVPLLKESPHVTELDLRDNAIGKNGKMALKKVRRNLDSYVACVGEWTALRMHASGNR